MDKLMVDYSYTAEDFEQAEFAIDPSKDYPLTQSWMRDSTDTDCPWHNGRGEFASDDEMTAERCIPVYAEPYSPEALRRAWEHGEKPEPGEQATEGTVSIVATDKHPRLHVNSEGERLLTIERIIYRPPAPAPEPDPMEHKRNRDAIYAHLCDLAGTMIIGDDTLDKWAGELAQHLTVKEQGGSNE